MEQCLGINVSYNATIFAFDMSPYYIIILLLGSGTLYVKIKALKASVKSGNREKIAVDIFFLLLTIAVVVFLVFMKKGLN